MSVAAMGVTAADAPSKSRSGLYSRTPVEQPSAAPAEAAGLYSPLRAAPTGGGIPRPDEGIGTEVPVGSMPMIILLAGAAYLSFVCIRNRKELRVKN